jgi:hypothetical protein
MVGMTETIPYITMDPRPILLIRMMSTLDTLLTASTNISQGNIHTIHRMMLA